MPKLQKQPPPAYPGKSIPPSSLQTAVPYENLPPSSQQPVPVTTALTPSQFNDFPSTNPFSPNFNASSTLSATFSPVSPVSDSRPVERLSQPQLHAPKPQRSEGQQRRSVDLRRLDGKPYPSSNPPDKSQRVVKVAKDMHDGALPPVYKRQASDPINPNEVSDFLGNALECGKCGKKRGEGSLPGNNCSHCGKRRTSGPETASTPPAPAAHVRNVSGGQISQRSGASVSSAGPSSSPASSTGTRCCNKCGRYKRPASLPIPQGPFAQGRPNGAGPATAPMPMANHPAMKIHQAGLSIQPKMGQNNQAYPQIDIIPPSASTYNAVNSRFSLYGDDSPLVANATKHEFRLLRNSSLVRSLSRRLSKKDKKSAPLPSQQLAANENQTGEQSAGRLINMISSAMQGNTHDRDAAHYARLGEEEERPSTPFSFVGGKDELDAFEMVDLRDKASTSSHDSLKEVVEPEIKVSDSEARYSGIPQDTIDVIPRSKSSAGQHLSVNDADRPQITRFKSLRQGVSRMNSVSRSTSLKRLGSLKTVHRNWYRDDMAIEGATGENAVPVF